MVKRAVDIVLGTLLAIAVTPLVVILAMALAVQFRASPFFVQHRMGRGGRAFRIVKLRTLPPDAPAYADKYTVAGMRSPGLPDLLRRLHMDELPQLWLVPLGRMSLVGPRPEMAFLHERMSPGLAQQRVSVRPGCTGLWQISVDSGGLILEHPEYDLTYVQAPTLRFDLWILWHTARMMVSASHRVTLDQVPGWVGLAEPRDERALSTS